MRSEGVEVDVEVEVDGVGVGVGYFWQSHGTLETSVKW